MARGLEPSPACQLGRLMDHGTMVGWTDAQILERFANRGDEHAFEALVARHGRMVLWVCRSVLRDSHDAEDAFQATFLVLARKARSLWVKETLANWLYRIAVRIAFAARTNANERRRHERLAAETRAAGASPASGGDPYVMSLICEELAHLPAKYREPIILCHLEELTHEAAARVLQCPIGTVHGRLSRARSLLRKRLARRGLATLTTLTASALLEGRSLAAHIPPALAQSTVRSAINLVVGNAISPGLVAATVASMTARTLRCGTTNLVKKIGLLGLFTILTVGTGLRLYTLNREQPAPTAASPPARPEATSGVGRGTQVPTMIPVFAARETDWSELTLPPVKDEPLFLDFDSARILWPPFDLETRDSKYPLVLPNVAFTERLRQWVRSTGVDAVIQTDGLMVHMMGLDLQISQPDATSALNGIRWSSPALPGPLIRSREVFSLLYLTREGTQGTFFANLGKQKTSPLTFTIKQDPVLAGHARKTPAQDAETLILGKHATLETICVENGKLVLRGSETGRRIEIGGGTVKVKNGSDTMFEASRIVTPLHDLDGRREQLVYPEGGKLIREASSIHFLVTKPEVAGFGPILMPARSPQAVETSVRLWGQLQGATIVQRSGDQIKITSGETTIEAQSVQISSVGTSERSR